MHGPASVYPSHAEPPKVELREPEIVMRTVLPSCMVGTIHKLTEQPDRKLDEELFPGAAWGQTTSSGIGGKPDRKYEV